MSSRVSAKIQQLVNTLKRPKRPPLREFFVDDFEELLEGKMICHLPSFPPPAPTMTEVVAWPLSRELLIPCSGRERELSSVLGFQWH